jgi:adenylate kinase
VKLVFLGPPGAGKGTLADLYARQYGAEHFSTGDMLRAEITAGTALGQEARALVEAGRLVPQKFLGRVVANRLQGVGAFVLDGYPRTLEQAEFLTHNPGIAPEAAVFVAVPEDVAVRRLLSRLVCEGCGAITNAADIQDGDDCAKCGGKLVTRADDEAETIKRRYGVYLAETAPVVDYYRRAGILLEIDGTGKPPAVFARLEAALKSFRPAGHDNA